MQIHTLTNAIFSIEKMVGSEGQTEQLFVQLHKLSKQITSFAKTHQSIFLQNKQSQKERQQLRKRLKKTTAKLEKKEEECQQLRNQLVSTKDMYDHKIKKLLKEREEKPCEDQKRIEKKIERKASKADKSREIQCQILNEPLVKELQERNLCLLRKINNLEKELEEQKNESNSKQLYIESLLTALDGADESDFESSSEEELQTIPGSASCQDINDVSTIDADSLKDEEHQLESFPQEERKNWHETEIEGVDGNQRWYSSMLNVLRRVRGCILRR